MAGDVKVAVVSAALSTSDGGTTDFTGPTDFGTPKACIVLMGTDDTDDAAVDNQSINLHVCARRRVTVGNRVGSCRCSREFDFPVLNTVRIDYASASRRIQTGVGLRFVLVVAGRPRHQAINECRMVARVYVSDPKEVLDAGSNAVLGGNIRADEKYEILIYACCGLGRAG